tara:strand:- start:8698 stop:8919 length:222 start_codon:yes stop_codon:yes gene_type:complete
MRAVGAERKMSPKMEAMTMPMMAPGERAISGVEVDVVGNDSNGKRQAERSSGSDTARRWLRRTMSLDKSRLHK